MFGFLKNLLRKSPDGPVESQLERGTRPVSGAVEDLEAAAPPPVAKPTPTFKGPPLSKSSAPQSSKGIEVPVQRILENLPVELQPLVRRKQVGDLAISVPLEKILAQL